MKPLFKNSLPLVLFTTLLFGVDGIGDGPYTVRDIWDGTSIVDAVYVYDTVLDLIHRSDDEGDSDESGVSNPTLYHKHTRHQQY